MSLQKIKLTAAALLVFGICCAGNSPLSQYTEAIKALSHDFSMDYKSVLTYPGNKIFTVEGHYAVRNENFCDSSNLRFAFKNDKWMLIADHQNKEIDFLYMPQWKKDFGENVQPNTSGFMLTDDQLQNYQSLKITVGTANDYKVNITYNNTITPFKELVLHFTKGNLTPLDYEGTLAYPSWEAYGREDGAVAETDTSHIYIHFSCYNIKAGTDPAIFDDSRLIDTRHGKAILRRYNNYKTTVKSSR